jgi:hypothetical protein
VVAEAVDAELLEGAAASAADVAAVDSLAAGRVASVEVEAAVGSRAVVREEVGLEAAGVVRCDGVCFLEWVSGVFRGIGLAHLCISGSLCIKKSHSCHRRHLFYIVG